VSGYAIQNGNLSATEFFLDKGVNVNHLDNSGMSALMLSVIKRQLESVKLLLSRGASPKIGTADGLNPLAKAAHFCDFDIFEQLLKHTTITDADCDFLKVKRPLASSRFCAK
jgi:ankyrin repeat protein